MEITPEQITPYLDQFNNIYDENGAILNPPPKNVKLTAWCESIVGSGFLINMTFGEMGIDAFIIKKWIEHSELENLL